MEFDFRKILKPYSILMLMGGSILVQFPAILWAVVNTMMHESPSLRFSLLFYIVGTFVSACFVALGALAILVGAAPGFTPAGPQEKEGDS